MTEALVLDLVAEGRDLLAREHGMLIGGRFDQLPGLAGEKERFLARFEATAARAAASPVVIAELRGLIRISRRNEALIEAALSGVTAARRRLEGIAATRRGRVAYAQDGSPITSRADSAGPPVSL